MENTICGRFQVHRRRPELITAAAERIESQGENRDLNNWWWNSEYEE